MRGQARRPARVLPARIGHSAHSGPITQAKARSALALPSLRILIASHLVLPGFALPWYPPRAL